VWNSHFKASMLLTAEYRIVSVLKTLAWSLYVHTPPLYNILQLLFNSDSQLQGGPKKVSLLIFAITLSTASQFS